MFCDSTLVSHTFSEWALATLIVVRPGGVTWPVPEFSGVWFSK